jgi:hypothetical protein
VILFANQTPRVGGIDRGQNRDSHRGQPPTRAPGRRTTPADPEAKSITPSAILPACASRRAERFREDCLVSSPSDDGGLVQNFVRSFYSRNFYRHVPSLSFGTGLVHLLFLAGILGLVTAVQWSAAVGVALNAWNARLESGALPALRLNQGRLEVRGDQPYVARESFGLLVIDTTGTHTALPESLAAGLLLTRDRAVWKPGPGTVRTYEFKGQHLDFWLDEAGLRRFRSVATPAALAVGTPAAFLYYAALNFALLALLALAALAADRVFGGGAGLRFPDLLKIGFFAVTPVAIGFRFLGLVAPRLAASLLPLYPALTAFLLLVAIRRAAPEPPPGDPAP